MNGEERASRLQSLKPGDEVIVFRRDVPLWLRKVSSVTKSGRVPSTVPTIAGIRGWCLWASAALSEVAALGFNIEDAP